jgi:hypothetical protein
MDVVDALRVDCGDVIIVELYVVVVLFVVLDDKVVVGELLLAERPNITPTTIAVTVTAIIKAPLITIIAIRIIIVGS